MSTTIGEVKQLKEQFSELLEGEGREIDTVCEERGRAMRSWRWRLQKWRSKEL